MADKCSECSQYITNAVHYIEPRFYRADRMPALTDPIPLLCSDCAKRIMREMHWIDRVRLGLPAVDLDVLRDAGVV